MPQAALAQKRHELVKRYRLHPLHLEWEIYRAANLREYATLIDLGCERAEFLLEVRRHWHHRGLLVGVDRDPAVLAEIAPVARSADVSLLCADASHLPCDEGSFDGVLVRHDLAGEHGILGIAGEIRRIVRPAGRAVFVAPARVNFRLCREFQRRLTLEDPRLVLAPRPIGLRLEDAAKVLSGVFGPHESRVFTDAVYLRSPETFLALFDTFRGDFVPWPDDASWQEARAKVARWASSWFDTRRTIAEPVTLGIFVATVI